ncbi:hypothetical protein [Bradyrhizobium sp. 186]|uniref:hypothetical protein n=1 Tax=Bradyrhizobium sp. 186 TaxID=2782654 RepID=UPI002000C07B|nr:hypothetical protein [Bradyrhizobium sp. 186]
MQGPEDDAGLAGKVALVSGGGYIRFKSKPDPRLRELAILQVGWIEKSEGAREMVRELAMSDAPLPRSSSISPTSTWSTSC